MAKKQGFLHRIIMGSENMPDFTPSKLPHTRWALWWDVVKSRFGALVKINLLLVLFLIPIAVVMLVSYLQESLFGTTIPATGNFGIGYPVVDNAQNLYDNMVLSVNINKFLFALPLFGIVGVGLSGACYTLRRLAWGEGISVGANFKEGIVVNWKNFLLAALLVGMSFFAMSFCFFGLDYFNVPAIAKVMLQVIGVIQFVFIVMMFMYFITQCVTYKLDFVALVKNSFLFALALSPQNIFFIALSALPILFLIIFASVTPIVVACWAILIFFGISNMLLVWTIFNHYVYDKFINDHVKGAVKNRNMYVKTADEEKQEQIDYIKTRNTIYGDAYASRRLSSIDKGQTFTPLGATYNRNDLLKLKEEKDAVEKEVENERQQILTDLKAEEERLNQLKEAESKNKKNKKRK